MLVETGYVSVSVLFLIISAMLYSRMLALTGMPAAVTEGITHLGLGPWGFLAAYVAIVIALGCIIDSVSIMLIMLPIVLPIARAFGMDIVWFGVITVVAVEIGLLTPPFGVSVYTVKSALNDSRITVARHLCRRLSLRADDGRRAAGAGRLPVSSPPGWPISERKPCCSLSS